MCCLYFSMILVKDANHVALDGRHNKITMKHQRMKYSTKEKLFPQRVGLNNKVYYNEKVHY